MEKHVYTFGDLKKGDHIFRYRIVNDIAKIETIVIENIKITDNKAIISILNIKDSGTIYIVDKDRQYITDITGGNNDDWSSSALVSDYELVEFMRTIINITKQPLIRAHTNIMDFILNK